MLYMEHRKDLIENGYRNHTEEKPDRARKQYPGTVCNLTCPGGQRQRTGKRLSGTLEMTHTEKASRGQTTKCPGHQPELCHPFIIELCFVFSFLEVYFVEPVALCTAEALYHWATCLDSRLFRETDG